MGMGEAAHASGKYIFECFNSDGTFAWREEIDNVVCTQGKNVALDAFLAGSGYTVVGPFLGLISSVSFSAVAVTDTMTAHAGWLEAGNANAPQYSGTRAGLTWGAAGGGSKATTSYSVFTFTGVGTVVGAFLVFGTGAANTIDNTVGALYSAGTFTGGAQAVGIASVLNVSYQAFM